MNNTNQKRKALRAWHLFIVAAIGYILSWFLGGESIYASAVGTIGFIALIMAVIALVREMVEKRKKMLLYLHFQFLFSYIYHN